MQIVILEQRPERYEQIAAALRAGLGAAAARQVAGERALRELLAGPAPALAVVADEPGWTAGLAAAAELLAAWPDTPVIMVAASGDEALAVAAIKAGLSDYLPWRELARLPEAARASLVPAQGAGGLRGQAARLRLITEMVTDSLYQIELEEDGGRRVVWSSDRAHSITGYSPEELRSAELLRRIYHPDDLPRIVAGLGAIRAGHEIADDIRLIARDGSTRWVHSMSRPYRDPASGRVAGYVGASRDITESKRAERALAFMADASSQLAQSLDESATLARAARLAVPFLADYAYIDLVQPDGARRRVAAAHVRPELEAVLLGQSAAPHLDLGGPTPVASVMRSGRPLLIAELSDAALAAAVETEGQARAVDALGRPGSVIVVPLVARGRTLGVFSFFAAAPGRRYDAADLTVAEEFARRAAIAADNARLLEERQALAEQAAAQAAELVAIFDHAPIGLALFEPRPPYRVLRHNRSILDLVGESWARQGSVLGIPLADLLDAASAAAISGIFGQVIGTGETFVVDEYELTLSDEQRPRFYAWSASPLRGPGGEPIGLLAGAVEITARKAAEEQRLKLERALQLAQKVEGLGTLAGGVAHDFNNLLTVIQGNLHLALADLPAGSPALDSLQRADLAARRAADLTAQLLAYAGKGTLDTRPIDLNALVHEMTGLLHASVPRGALLRLNLAAGLPAISGDATQIRQVVMNLVINAAEAIGEGAGVITVGTEERRVGRDELARARVGAELPAGRYVLLQIADNGQGMSAETLDRIFDPFFSTKFTGRGLGLAAVLGIVRGHRGALAVESAPGRGSAFTLLLPVAGAPPELRDAPAPGAATLLVVDDEPELRELVAEVARRRGLRVLTAADGEEAVLVYREHAGSISGAVVDLTMPRRDGAAAVEQLRALRPDLPIVLMSGYSAQEMGRRISGPPPAAFLHKPFAMSELLAALRLIVPT